MRRAQVDKGSQPVRNLFTNPALETLSGAQPLGRTNLATDPLATRVGLSTDVGWRTGRWFGSGVPTGTHTFITGASDGPLPELTTYIRKTWTSATVPANNGDTGFELVSGFNATVGSVFPGGWQVTAGTTYTMSAYLRATTGKASVQFDITWRDSTGLFVSRSISASQNLTAGTWGRISFTVTVPAGVTQAGVVLDTDGGTLWAQNDTLDGTGLLVEACDTLRPFFSGASAAYEDFTYVWTGTANNSTSQLKGLALPKGVSNAGNRFGCSSTQWSSSGTRSVRITAQSAAVNNNDTFVELTGLVGSYVFKPNTMYTLAGTCRQLTALGAPLFSNSRNFRVNIGSELTVTTVRTKTNTPGVERVVSTFKTGATVNMSFIRIYNGQSESNGTNDVWWDDLFLAEGDWTGVDHIDGTKPFSKWDGTVNDSTSVGYPPQLLDLAGKPLVDVTNAASGSTISVPAGPVTVYTVQSVGQTAGNPGYWEYSTGGTWLQTTGIVRLIGSTPTQGRLDILKPSGGSAQTSVTVNPMNLSVTATAMDPVDTGVDFQADGQTTYVTSPQATFHPLDGGLLRIGVRDNGTPGGDTVISKRVLLYVGKHDLPTRQAVSRYLGNKYGANVA